MDLGRGPAQTHTLIRERGTTQVSQGLVGLHDWPAGTDVLPAGPRTTFRTARPRPPLPAESPVLCRNICSGLAYNAEPHFGHQLAPETFIARL